ncbi:hypothetical protein RJ640_029667 [Escallonia rubra]|uniref:C2 domain-containing protein n=1 Tax=Escallonia rubra TaxID=112253 RepID=A0AA88RP99_9ASTE|nr:hypothetical protein RJ640_029667 [Escallonia rubra]
MSLARSFVDVAIFGPSDLDQWLRLKLQIRIFRSGPSDLGLRPENYLVPVDSAKKFCFSFAPTSASLSIIVPTDLMKKKKCSIGDEWIPAWNEEFKFPFTLPELAFLRIEVRDYDTTGVDDLAG